MSELQGRFPDWQFKKKGSRSIFAWNEKNAALYIKVRKSSVFLDSRFAKTHSQIFFVFSLLALGVVIPLAIYAAVFGKKMKLMRHEAANFVRERYQ